jgi:hypothetical protein
VSKSAEIPGTQAAAPHEVDLAAGRLLSAIDASCDPVASFPQQLEAALEAALELFAAEPDLVHDLVIRLEPEPIRVRQRCFSDACATRLRAASERFAARIESPPFVETFLIAAVQFEVSRSLHEDELSRLPERVPDLRDFILTYYAEGPAR